jgi:hypothetical protein
MGEPALLDDVYQAVNSLVDHCVFEHRVSELILDVKGNSAILVQVHHYR